MRIFPLVVTSLKHQELQRSRSKNTACSPGLPQIVCKTLSAQEKKEGGKANFLTESLGVLFWKCIASLGLDNESLEGARSLAPAAFLRPVNTTFQR